MFYNCIILFIKHNRINLFINKTANNAKLKYSFIILDEHIIIFRVLLIIYLNQNTVTFQQLPCDIGVAIINVIWIKGVNERYGLNLKSWTE